jgi:hypothetical protein
LPAASVACHGPFLERLVVGDHADLAPLVGEEDRELLVRLGPGCGW